MQWSVYARYMQDGLCVFEIRHLQKKGQVEQIDLGLAITVVVD